ncbi:MAG TPA: hypothetical protein VGO90_05005 [Chthoniobacteraceae bacterium]|jgi:hypothetical protein|nr:hypothetical protein [Chthoniobacteraceae bacterium]
MRTLLILVVIGALGYLGYTYQEEIKEQFQKITQKGEPAKDSEETAQAPGAEAPSGAVQPAATPAEKRTAPPGVYYVTKRVSVQVEHGIKALVPGEMVKIVFRNKNGTARVTTGKEDFDVKESQLTNDLATAERARQEGGLP